MNRTKELSLRERSKAKRRVAIERAAMRLFVERGYEATTIADIAAEAEVAPRTVSLYFPSKADLALAHVNALAQRFTAAVAARASGATLLDVIDRWLLAEGALIDPEDVRLHAAMFEANPILRAQQSVHIAEAMQAAWRALAEYLGVDVDHLAVPVAGSAMGGALSGYMMALAAGADVQTAHDTVMHLLRAGIDALRSAPA